MCAADVAKGARLGVLDASRTTVVYNGIVLPDAEPTRGPFREELGLGSDTPLVLSIGRFHEQKDQAMLLHAWAAVVAKRPEARLALVGAGELEGRLREVAHALKLSDSVSFVAPRAGLAAAYTDSDVFALSSRWEGLPYVVIEAMSHGLPVAATAVDGVPEAVIDGETGLLVASGDSPALGAALLKLLDDASLRRAMGEAGRLRVAERFSIDAMIAGLLGVYRTVAPGAFGEVAT